MKPDQVFENLKFSAKTHLDSLSQCSTNNVNFLHLAVSDDDLKLSLSSFQQKFMKKSLVNKAIEQLKTNIVIGSALVEELPVETLIRYSDKVVALGGALEYLPSFPTSPSMSVGVYYGKSSGINMKDSEAETQFLKLSIQKQIEVLNGWKSEMENYLHLVRTFSENNAVSEAQRKRIDSIRERVSSLVSQIGSKIDDMEYERDENTDEWQSFLKAMCNSFTDVPLRDRKKHIWEIYQNTDVRVRKLVISSATSSNKNPSVNTIQDEEKVKISVKKEIDPNPTSNMNLKTQAPLKELSLVPPVKKPRGRPSEVAKEKKSLSKKSSPVDSEAVILTDKKQFSCKTVTRTEESSCKKRRTPLAKNEIAPNQQQTASEALGEKPTSENKMVLAEQDESNTEKRSRKRPKWLDE